MSDEAQAPDQVLGERGARSVTRSLSVQSRLSNILAILLMGALGLGALTWYYANAMTRSGRAREGTMATARSQAPGDVPLPSLGRIVPPPPPLFDAPGGEPPLPVAPVPLNPQTLEEVALVPSPPGAANGAAPVKTAEQLAVERQLSGTVFASQSSLNDVPAPAPRSALPPEPGELAPLLRTSGNPPTTAHVLPAQRLLLPRGAFIDCTLETAIDSSLPGMTTCVMATDAFGVDGNVVLLERGTKLIGETRGQVREGAARVFVLWTEARSPSGVIVPLDSPGADELGRSGLPGEVDRHFWQRFGAAMLVSVIDGAVQAAAQSAHAGSGNVVLNPSSSQDVLTEILRSTINVPPTITKQNGDRIQVLVARDVDFRSVYELRSAAARH